MKFDPDTIKYIENAVSVAQIVGIDSLVIDKDSVRGLDENQTVLILQTENLPDLGFEAIGLSRLPSFISRLNIAKSVDNFSIDADVYAPQEKNEEEFVRSLTMKGKGVKVEYRCANPAQIRAPRKMNDTFEFSVDLTEDAIGMLQRGQAAMKADEASIISNDGVSFEIVDVNNDVFSHQFADDAVNILGESNTKFAYRYPIKILLALFKHDSDGSFAVGKKGMLRIKINGLYVYVIPQV